jgi:hypothetical protein
MKAKSVTVLCRGCGADDSFALSTPVEVLVKLEKYGALIMSAPDNCPHNAGKLGQRCKASHPDQEKVGDGVLCRFSFDYPDACQSAHWQVPPEVKDAISELDKD